MFISIFNRPVRRVYRRRVAPKMPEVSQQQREELTAYLTVAVEQWRITMGEEPITWKIRNMRSQWGNCRPQRRLITFNLQLALVDPQLREYIIVHELSHLQVPNHGPAFKARETQFLPDWRERRLALKNYLIQLSNMEKQIDKNP